MSRACARDGNNSRRAETVAFVLLDIISYDADIDFDSPAVTMTTTTDTIVQPPVACDHKRPITKLETSEFAVDGMTVNKQLEARWKRSRGLRHPASCNEYHPYLNPDPSFDPDRDAETTDAAAAKSVPTSTHSKRKRSEKSQFKISKKTKSKHAKSAKTQSTDVQTGQPASKRSKGSRKLKKAQPSTLKPRRTGKDRGRMPEYDDFFDDERDLALMDTFGTLGGEMLADTYGYELTSRMDPAAWDYNFF